MFVFSNIKLFKTIYLQGFSILKVFLKTIFVVQTPSGNGQTEPATPKWNSKFFEIGLNYILVLISVIQVIN